MMMFIPKGMALVLAMCCLGLFLRTEAATVHYRSVGAGATTALVSGDAVNTIDVNGNTAVFTQTLPTTLVLGDVVQYDIDNDGTVDRLAIITELTDSFTIKMELSDGSPPTDTAGPSVSWAIFRAYTSLSSAVTGMENTGIETGLRDFDPFFGSKNLVAADQSWVIICCSSNQADTIPVMINGWITNETHTLTLKTPAGLPLSYVSHRHIGRWTPEAYRFVTNGSGLEVNSNHVFIEGLQFGYGNGSNSQYKQLRIDHPGSGQLFIGHNLFAGKYVNSANNYGIQIEASGSGLCTIWNNIFYDFRVDSGYSGNGIRMNDPDVNVYVYNNTAYNCKSGFNAMQGPVLAQNNIAQQCDDGFEGSFAGGSNFNISDSANDAPGNNLGVVVQFLNASVMDFHLATSDTVATDAGMDLSGNPQHSFNDDTDGQIRSGTWDLGADEGGPVLVPTNTPEPTATFSSTPTPTTTFTITPTGTPTALATPTPVVTATSSSTPTSVLSPTPTATMSPTIQYTAIASGTLHIRGNVLRKPGTDRTIMEVHCRYSQALRIRIYNQQGEVIATLIDEQQARGRQQVIWEGQDRYGQYVRSGVYIVHVRSEEINTTRKLVVVR